MTHATPLEPIVEPELPIVDAHHHLWVMPDAALKGMEGAPAVAAKALAPTYRRHARYLLDEFLGDLDTGHNIRATVFADCYAMYRSGGPDHLKSVGEVEFANGVAAMAASGLFGEIKVCAGIVGGVDLRLGDAVEEVLLAQRQAGGVRYRGIRGAGIIYDEDTRILGGGVPQVLPVKLGGLGLPFGGFKSFGSSATAAQLAEEWKPYIDTCIEAFGAERCMFQSNFPVDSATSSYPVLWNAFKRLAAGASKAEKTALFSGTASRIYQLEI